MLTEAIDYEMTTDASKKLPRSELTAASGLSCAVLDALDDAVLLLDTDNKISAFNATASAMLSCQVGQKLADLAGGDKDQRRLLQTLSRKAWRERVSAEITLTQNPERVVMLTMKPLSEEAKRLAVIRDITKEKRNERSLRELATRDELTRCYNRRYFIAALEAEIERQRRYGGARTLLLMDIDHFKRINDRYGHAVGDSALAMLADVGGKIFRENDVFARLGGEEFAVLLPETSVDNAELIAERFRQNLRNNAVPGAPEGVFLTVSIGVTPIRSVMTPTTALKTADAALYRAKRSGRNRVVTSHAA